ncbi:MAG TPA: hypothetical protein VEP50_14770 [bacterium]|nr:hypothetical protein [bacterium]
MLMHSVLLVLSTFLASAVEMVEALTIVLAVGVTRGWRPALVGVAAAVLALAAIVAVFGPALTYIPIDALRLVVGILLLVFGLQWLRKAVLRAAGYVPLHDEDAAFRREMEAARVAPTVLRGGLDWYGFTLSFKGVLLEGLEVAFIVVTFGTTEGSLSLAIFGAAAAAVLVAGTGVLVHRPLSAVPENTMKFAVGLMLTTFGTFWSAEGAGVTWPGGDGAIPGILVFLIAVSLAFTARLRQQRRQMPAPATIGTGGS